MEEGIKFEVKSTAHIEANRTNITVTIDYIIYWPVFYLNKGQCDG
jgi:hypothetical protein